MAGLVIGLIAGWPIRRLPLGIDERIRQPRWTWSTTRTVPVVAASGLAGAVLGYVAPSGRALVIGLVVLVFVVPATAIDLRWRVVPDTLIVLGGASACLALLLIAPDRLVAHGAIGLAAGIAVGLLALASRGALGLGDAKLVAVLGLALGWALPWALLIGTLLAGLAAPWVVWARGRRSTIPLVPFLAAGALVAAGMGVGVPGGG
jgi:prepilin signal peptidase PulO-like enzyme (type II secretory pathway)